MRLVDAELGGDLAVRPLLEHREPQHLRVAPAQRIDRRAHGFTALRGLRDAARRFADRGRTRVRRRVGPIEALDLARRVAPLRSMAPCARADLPQRGLVQPLLEGRVAHQLQPPVVDVLEHVAAHGLREILGRLLLEHELWRTTPQEPAKPGQVLREQRLDAHGARLARAGIVLEIRHVRCRVRA